MIRIEQFILFGSLLSSFSGCVSPPSFVENPFEGVYKVTSHTRNEKDCNSPGGAVTDGDKFFKLTEEVAFNAKILAYRSCTNANTCEADLKLFPSFFNEGNGWMRRIKSATPRGTDRCELQLVEGPLVKTQTGFVIEWKSFERTISLAPGEICHSDIVDKHRAELICKSLEAIVAERQ